MFARQSMSHSKRIARRNAALTSAVRFETLEDRRLMADVSGGLIANYYADSNFQNLALARTDASVDFNWGTGSPVVFVSA